MARLKLKQVLSNLAYDSGSNVLSVSGSSQQALVVSGSVLVSSTVAQTGSLTIQGADTFGDSGSFFTVDLGTY